MRQYVVLLTLCMKNKFTLLILFFFWLYKKKMLKKKKGFTKTMKLIVIGYHSET